MRLKASAPGSLMLLGEHAVLHGKMALVSAIDKRMTVILTPRTDKRIEITSTLGHFSTNLAQLKIEKPFQFVLCALHQFRDQLHMGFDITIESEFSDKIGFASSAAVTVATLKALAQSLAISLSPLELVSCGRDVVRHIQGVGSGADIAASVYGGVVSYRAHPVSVEKINVMLPLHAIYSGYKTETVKVIEYVWEKFAKQSELFHSICENIGECSVTGTNFVREKSWVKLGEVMNAQQVQMERLGVSSPLLQAMVMDLRKQSGIVGTKISGSGLGDCVIALGKLPPDYQCVIENQLLQRIPVSTTLEGVKCEKI